MREFRTSGSVGAPVEQSLGRPDQFCRCPPGTLMLFEDTYSMWTENRVSAANFFSLQFCDTCNFAGWRARESGLSGLATRAARHAGGRSRVLAADALPKR